MDKKVMKQFSKFAIIGVINTAINLISLLILTEIFNIYYMTSAVFAFILAVTNSFVLNKLWTFNESFNENFVKKYIKFIVVSTITLLVNLVILYSLTEFLHIHYIISQIIAIAVSLWINFMGNLIWTFKK